VSSRAAHEGTRIANLCGKSYYKSVSINSWGRINNVFIMNKQNRDLTRKCCANCKYRKRKIPKSRSTVESSHYPHQNHYSWSQSYGDILQYYKPCLLLRSSFCEHWTTYLRYLKQDGGDWHIEIEGSMSEHGTLHTPRCRTVGTEIGHLTGGLSLDRTWRNLELVFPEDWTLNFSSEAFRISDVHNQYP